MKIALIFFVLAAVAVAEKRLVSSKMGALIPEQNSSSVIYLHSENEQCTRPVFKFFGMKRNGNHMAIDWILTKLNAKSYMLNCMVPATRTDEIAGHGQYWKAVDTDKVSYWRDCIVSLPNYMKEVSLRYLPCGETFMTEQEYGCEPVIMSFENYNFDDLEQLHKISNEADTFDEVKKYRPTAPEYNVAIVRDPFNAAATYLMLLMTPPKASATPMSVEDAYAEIKDTYLPEWKRLFKIAIEDETNDVVGINYNKFVDSREYRNEIAMKLGFGEDHDNISQVPDVGGGSSFSGIKLNHHAAEMKTDERFLKEEYRDDEKLKKSVGRHVVFLQDPLYLDLFRSDPELLPLSKKHFGVDPFKGGPVPTL